MRVAEQWRNEVDAWLTSLPNHCRRLYSSTGLHGPLLQRMHTYLVSLGYPDTELFKDVSQGFPSGGVLPRTGLWPLRPDAEQIVAARTSTREVFREAPKHLRDVCDTRRPDKFAEQLLENGQHQVRSGRR